MTEHEPVIRLGVFFTLVFVFIAWEIIKPRRTRILPVFQRWRVNISLLLIDTLVLRICFPLAAVGIAHYNATQGWGLFNQLQWTHWSSVLIAIALLDFLIYWQHRLFHKIPWLWRLHKVHHTDLEFDISTGIRFHPLEILLSMLIKLCAITLFGLPAVGVLIFEVLLNSSSLFNHSNIYINTHIDRLLRWLIVTPDMHRIHHSQNPKETDSNFSFSVSWWDRLFKTYRMQAAEPQETMALGLREFQDPAKLDLKHLLCLPVKSPPANKAHE